MIQRITAILLILEVLLPFGVKTGTIIHFKLNQAEIAAKYCVNKNKPKLKCDGKCHLMKSLDDLEKKSEIPESSFPIKKVVETEITYVLPYLSFLPSLHDLAEVAIIKESTHYQQSFYSFRYSCPDFHPPEVIS